METVKLYFPELSCSSCLSSIEKKLNTINDIKYQTNLVGKSITIDYDPTKITKKEMLKQIKKAGFEYDEVPA
ncbi:MULTISPECIES: cation transporter [Spiroplasma]|uniref:Heavy-metal transporting ATPase n=1 Tax=Spiroplasma eriocheiris TaxID=315358 RepID=A0A0H3XM82_9MOLU|nr:cation transporter [Spiroplasma eriocheiris]AHF58257.1 hypothetical protein SPE_1143 [Spiroplasma eriocheiris CCTCC M 207170]AKM54694.1 heavy-metal transporting ATPase [Spiroplasma eriocheiris]